MVDSRRYRADHRAEFLIHPLEDLTLIYHRRSGVTHMMTSPVPEILAAMDHDLLDAKQILERLSNTYDLEAGEAESLEAVLGARLEELVALGLAERL